MTKIRLATGVALLASQVLSIPAIAGNTPNPLRRATERACIHEGRQQGYLVQRVGKVQVVSGSEGRETATRAALWVKREGSSYQVRCDYSAGDRVAKITPMNGGGSGSAAG